MKEEIDNLKHLVNPLVDSAKNDKVAFNALGEILADIAIRNRNIMDKGLFMMILESCYNEALYEKRYKDRKTKQEDQKTPLIH